MLSSVGSFLTSVFLLGMVVSNVALAGLPDRQLPIERADYDDSTKQLKLSGSVPVACLGAPHVRLSPHPYRKGVMVLTAYAYQPKEICAEVRGGSYSLAIDVRTLGSLYDAEAEERIVTVEVANVDVAFDLELGTEFPQFELEEISGTLLQRQGEVSLAMEDDQIVAINAVADLEGFPGAEVLVTGFWLRWHTLPLENSGGITNLGTAKPVFVVLGIVGSRPIK